jgi:hypothetical protein
VADRLEPAEERELAGELLVTRERPDEELELDRAELEDRDVAGELEDTRGLVEGDDDDDLVLIEGRDEVRLEELEGFLLIVEDLEDVELREPIRDEAEDDCERPEERFREE